MMTDEPPAKPLTLPNPRVRWGDAVDPGVLIVPTALFKHQHRLGVGLAEVAVICHILALWDDDDGWPYPPIAKIARRANVSRRTIERAILDLTSAELLRHMPRETCGGEIIRRFDLSGLVAKLAAHSRQEPETQLKSRPAA